MDLPGLWFAATGAINNALQTVARDLLRLELKAEEAVQVTLHGKREVPKQRRPLLDDHVHCDVVQARGLLSREETKDHPSAPPHAFVECTLLVPGDGCEHARAKTGVRVATLHPVYDEELLLADVEGASAVRFSLHDAGLVGKDSLAFVDVPLPPRPPPLHARPQAAAPLPIVQGWFPLRAPPEALAELQPRLERLGLVGSPAPLGEMHVRVSWGMGVQNPALNHRTPLRRRLARLAVCIHAAEGLPPKFADRPTVIARLEAQTGVTPHAEETACPVWPRDAATFVFAVTEVTADLVLTVIDADPVMGAQTVGEVVVPVRSLLSGAAPREQWAAILPGRAPGEALLRPQPAPAVPLGRLHFSVALKMEASMPFAFLGPDVPPREHVPGADRSDAFSVEALHSSLGRVLDCAFAVLFAPLRTVLYLQTWQAPRLNAGLLALLLLATRREHWAVTLRCTPLWLLLAPFLHCAVGSRIRAGDTAPLTAEEHAELERRRRALEAYAIKRARLVTQARIHLLAKAAKRDPSLARHRLDVTPIGRQLSQLGGALSAAVQKTHDEAENLNLIKQVMGKLRSAHAGLLATADSAERLMAACDWSDPWLTSLLFLMLLCVGLAASAVVAAIVAAATHVGLHSHTMALLSGLACFAPPAKPLTRSLLAAADDCLSSLSGIAHVTPLLAGAGLAVTAPREQPMLQGEALQKACEAEAQLVVDAQHLERQAELQARGQLRHTSLNLADALSGAWLRRLLQRAPNVPRKQHLAMTRRVLAGGVPAPRARSH